VLPDDADDLLVGEPALAHLSSSRTKVEQILPLRGPVSGGRVSETPLAAEAIIYSCPSRSLGVDVGAEHGWVWKLRPCASSPSASMRRPVWTLRTDPELAGTAYEAACSISPPPRRGADGRRACRWRGSRRPWRHCGPCRLARPDARPSSARSREAL